MIDKYLAWRCDLLGQIHVYTSFKQSAFRCRMEGVSDTEEVAIAKRAWSAILDLIEKPVPNPENEHGQES